MWSELYGPYSTFQWIGDRLNGAQFDNPDSGSRWRLDKKLSERSRGSPDKTTPCWAFAVYQCSDLHAQWPDAIMKIWEQYVLFVMPAAATA